MILNPYGNSPLTALILFETEEKVTPKVTILGKDELSTFEHTFEENTKLIYQFMDFMLIKKMKL